MITALPGKQLQVQLLQPSACSQYVLLHGLHCAQTFTVGPQAAVRCGLMDAEAVPAAASIGAANAGMYDSDGQKLTPALWEGGRPARPTRPVVLRKPKEIPRKTPARPDISFQKEADMQRLRMQGLPVNMP